MVDLEFLFPGLSGSSYQITSPPTQTYNCIAWAADDVTQWWWPDRWHQRYWLAGVNRAETVSAFEEAFATLGFAVCPLDDLEPGFEKIAVFADANGPQHAARQLANGRWTSKLGDLEDIEHGLHDLEGAEYGKVVLPMKRAQPVAHA